MQSLSRRTLLHRAALAGAVLGLPGSLVAWARRDPDRERLADWVARLRAEGLCGADVPLGRRGVRVGELAAGTPYVPGTLEEYIRAGGHPATEPLALSLTRFDCVTLVESCLAVARVAGQQGEPTWERFGHEMERMRYRGGVRRGYGSRLHYFSEWIRDGAERGLVRNLGPELGAANDNRPLRFMTEHRASYPALADDGTFAEIGAMERRLDACPKWVVPAARLPEVTSRIETGDVLAFATTIPGLDVSHAAFAYRDRDGYCGCCTRRCQAASWKSRARRWSSTSGRSGAVAGCWWPGPCRTSLGPPRGGRGSPKRNRSSASDSWPQGPPLTRPLRDASPRAGSSLVRESGATLVRLTEARSEAPRTGRARWRRGGRVEAGRRRCERGTPRRGRGQRAP